MTDVHIYANIRTMLRELVFYRRGDGTAPVEEFLDSLSDKAVQKILAVFKLVENLDVIPKKFFKKLTNTNIWECRIKWQSDIFRVFCFFDKGRIVVLTHGMVKKTQKIPTKEIEKAERYREDYLSRRKQ